MKEHELVVEYLTRRHSAKTANQIPEGSRKDWMAKLEEQIDQGMRVIYFTNTSKTPFC